MENRLGSGLHLASKTYLRLYLAAKAFTSKTYSIQMAKNGAELPSQILPKYFMPLSGWDATHHQ